MERFKLCGFFARSIVPIYTRRILCSFIWRIDVQLGLSTSGDRVELSVMDWLAQALHLPDRYVTEDHGDGGGIMMSSASESILTVMTAARDMIIRYWQKDTRSGSMHGQYPGSSLPIINATGETLVRGSALGPYYILRVVTSNAANDGEAIGRIFGAVVDAVEKRRSGSRMSDARLSVL